MEIDKILKFDCVVIYEKKKKFNVMRVFRRESSNFSERIYTTNFSQFAVGKKILDQVNMKTFCFSFEYEKELASRLKKFKIVYMLYNYFYHLDGEILSYRTVVIGNPFAKNYRKEAKKAERESFERAIIAQKSYKENIKKFN